MSDEAVIIQASAEACRLARLHGCTLTLRIGGRRLRGVGPVELTISPNPLLRGQEPADGDGDAPIEHHHHASGPLAIDLPPKGPGYP